MLKLPMGNSSSPHLNKFIVVLLQLGPTIFPWELNFKITLEIEMEQNKCKITEKFPRLEFFCIDKIHLSFSAFE
jgi:hypothetical protein